MSGAAQAQRIGVIVSTYNKPQVLAPVLEGWRRQNDCGFELFVADDGSGEPTRQLIERVAADFPVPLHHIWQEDAGFRLARVRNLAIRAATDCDYLIVTDGDCIPLPGMVAAHRRMASAGAFLNGERLLLAEAFTARFLAAPWPLGSESTVRLIGRTLKGELNRMLPLLLPVLATARSQKLPGLRGCHLSFWRRDLLAANGFDESYMGWGREDSDLAARLFHAGIERRNLRGMPLLHLWHPEAKRDAVNRNDALLAACIEARRIKAAIGLEQLDG